MFGWKLDRTINIGQLITIAAIMVTLMGLHFSAAAERAEIDATSKFRDAELDSHQQRTAERQVEILEELKGLREDHNELQLEYREHAARTER